MKRNILLLFLFFAFALESQIIYNIAGSGFIGNGGDGGLAINASFNMPVGIAYDSAGSFYISDITCSCVRKVNSSGIINTVAGTPGFGGYSGDGGPATSAKLISPNGLAIDASGNVYIADGNVIRKINNSGIIATIAGAGTSTADGISANTASLSLITDVAVDNSNNLFLVDGSRIRKIDQLGIISTVAGTGNAGFSGDGGLATQAQLYGPEAIAIDGAGNLFIADGNAHCVRKVNSSGIISTIAGVGGLSGYSGDGGAASSAKLNFPTGIAIDASNNIYISDNDRVIRKVDSFGIISTIAGTIVVAGYNGSGIPASTASLNFPRKLVTDMMGNLAFCDRDNHRVRIICNTSCLQSINEYDLENDLTIYPNPVINSFWIKASIKYCGKYSIINSVGEEILNGTIYENKYVDVSNLVDGVYMLYLENGRNKSTFKFIKQSD